ncbi:hypothetical protein LTR48_007412 [Friedmanniomyces endolithicus]|uniref:Uncharacterized protein n=1 Tax=Rachicladosporium monterosium TaxID=1507873 RepID=A0ABR0KXM3_9PEZI|nr:hypothetical protein LTR29_014204 [Friedmanniomyces endolithicus]KAK1081615.1 hypothetical protein LTR48_007412 [Friedmanniomyces endolithicus]KAK5139477.1 hypothetical protein LTR32_007406 [Rachicladosporium monterosium]
MSKHRASTAVTALDSFDSRTAGEHDPGQIIILFDHRHILPRPEDNKMSSYQTYYLDGLSRMGWATYWEKPILDPGKIQLVWYTHAGAQGTRNYPLHKCHLVKEMFDSLSTEGFRPLILGWSAENPYPMIGGIEPPPPPKAPKMKVVTSTSGTVSGHGGKDGVASTPHDRVMAIIVKEEEREAKARAEIVEREKKAEALGYGV